MGGERWTGAVLYLDPKLANQEGQHEVCVSAPIQLDMQMVLMQKNRYPMKGKPLALQALLPKS